MNDRFPKLTSHTVGNFDSRLLAVSRPLHCIKINVSYKETHVSAVDPFIVGEINYEDTNE